jgi:hypothetical protein
MSRCGVPGVLVDDGHDGCWGGSAMGTDGERGFSGPPPPRAHLGLFRGSEFSSHAASPS